MQKIHRLWFADWRDADGVRHRKGFKTRRSAAAFQRRMREATHGEKKSQASRAFVASSRPTAKANRSQRTPRRKSSRKPSRQKRAA